MNTPTFELQTESLIETIREFQVSNPGVQTSALVYGVAYPELYRELRQWLGQDVSSQRLSLIFDASSEDHCNQYGPYVVRISATTAQPSSLLTRLAQCCVDDYRAVSFLFSQLAFDDIVAGLRERLDVICDDRSEWQMKFFDTRSLSVLDRALSSEQHEQYFGLAKEWWHIDRYGALNKIRCTDTAVDQYRGPLQLNEAQTAAFVEACLPDSILHVLQLTDDDLVAAFDARTRYRICEESIANAPDDERNSAVLLADRVRSDLLNALDPEEKACR
ncbi:DUF4123 domain-containing protein [Burkholderia dolosa]|jgi:hypothetical protein|uniref:DUF4123 domain-containing protein n=1 Tax=Burkholderia dolosa TaxID=152500 RepID=A0A892IF82_9BURK|nr:MULTISPECIES: DUF4123 domain-containing protein [Burkholderia]AKE05953.1 hypothetical protein XM57_25590 [Burkholderia cepacia]AJY10163.1 hypothetical protein AK34_3972 [Burkholderia dolosa AU0158]AYZ93715.1 DUF4123 domain-containing protein [Burkholderia dolosa]ETP63732.1 hypothetical protein BDSB_19655 [Burkholderia dolosa PC543]MBR8058044.1 DUF4123 domain-containing protein [Burkholderia dolosa]